MTAGFPRRPEQNDMFDARTLIMRTPRTLLIAAAGAFIALILPGPAPAPGQQEVVMTIREGMPAIPLALPDFLVRSASADGKAAATTVRDVLEADLKYSRVFQLLPKTYYQYVPPPNPDRVNFKDWDSVQAKILVTGQVSDGEGGGIVFDGKVFDVKAERFVFGKRYSAAKADLRLVAHKMADEIMKTIAGEKPVFTSKIAFVSNRDGNDEIYMMDYDGANPVRLTFNRVQDNLPAWSPDQSALVYTTYRRGNPDLVLRRIYEGKETVLSNRGMNFSGAFSPDGKRIAFSSSRDGNAEIYTCDPDGGNVKRVTFNSAVDAAPSWSATGRQIAFTSDRAGTGMPQIYICDAEGANVRKVSFGGNYHDAPAWSPSGDLLAYVSRVENLFDLYLLNLRTNQVMKLTESNARNENPSWSPDGRHLVFCSNMGGKDATVQVYSIDYDGTNLRRLTSEGRNKSPNWTN